LSEKRKVKNEKCWNISRHLLMQHTSAVGTTDFVTTEFIPLEKRLSGIA